MKIITFCFFAVLALSTSAGAKAEEGTFVRLLDIVVAPESVDEWESGVKSIAEGARAIGDSFCCDWLLYHEGEHRYRVVFFSDGFADLHTPRSFADLFDDTVGEQAFERGLKRLQESTYQVDQDLVHQVINAWSTVEAMSTSTHPKGRLHMYWVRPGLESDFDAAMRDHAMLLREVEYPYPVEAFEWRRGYPKVNYMAVFPDNWESFFGVNDPATYLRGHDRAAEYQAILARISAAVSRVEVHDIDFDAKLSF